MEMKQMEQAYQNIAHLLIQMIPEAWSKVLLYAEVGEGYGKVFFYYFPEGSSTPVYNLDIKKKFQIDSNKLEDLKFQIFMVCKELREEFIAQGQEPWSQLTYILDSAGGLKINYNYEDLSEISPVENQQKWEAEHLGIHR